MIAAGEGNFSRTTDEPGRAKLARTESRAKGCSFLWSNRPLAICVIADAKGSTWVEAVISLACNNRPRASVPTPMGRWMDWFQSTMEVVQTLGLGSRIERDVVMMIHTERLALPAQGCGLPAGADSGRGCKPHSPHWHIPRNGQEDWSPGAHVAKP